jgi:hypothetical protein
VDGFCQLFFPVRGRMKMMKMMEKRRRKEEEEEGLLATYHI